MKAHRLLKKAFDEYKKKQENFSMSQLSRDMGLPYSSIYNPIMQNRRCNADIWIKMMTHFGALEIDKKNVRIK